MLAHSHHAAILQTAAKGDGMPCHQLGALTEGAVADDGIQRVIVHIENRSEVHLDTHAAALACDLTSVLIEQHVVVHRAQDEVALEVGHLLEPHAQSPLAVDSDHQRDCSQRLGQVGYLDLFGDGAVLVDESANQVLGHKTAHQFTRDVVAAGSNCGDNELADACFGRQGIVHAVHPVVHRHLVHIVKHVRQLGVATRPCAQCERHCRDYKQNTIEFGHFS